MSRKARPRKFISIACTVSITLLTGCFNGGGGPSAGGGGISQLSALPGVAKEVSAKTPKYKLYCASTLASLKTPSQTQLIKEVESFDSSGTISLESKKISNADFCMVDVVVKSASDEAQFKWLAKGADGKALKGVYYRSNAVKPSAGKATIKLYRTYEEAAQGTLDLIISATFPDGTAAKDTQEGSLTCGTVTYKSNTAQPKESETSKTTLFFNLPKSNMQDKATTCSLSTTIKGDFFRASNIKIEPKAADSKLKVDVKLEKSKPSDDTLIIETEIED